MEGNTKNCKFCGKENFLDNNKCIHCGRFFVSDEKSQPVRLKQSRNDFFSSNFELIPPIVLLISLFLPWFSVFILQMSAFDIAKLFRMTLNMARQSDPVISLINILIYLIPVGCISVIIFSIKQKNTRMIGVITGSLPITISILLIFKGTGLLKIIGIGLIIAIISGVAMIIISLKNE